MITLTTEQAQQIEEALMKIADLRNLGKIQPEVIAFETLYIIRAARAQEQAEQDLDTCPGCGGVADNGHDREFPPNPYYCTKCSEQAEQELFDMDDHPQHRLCECRKCMEYFTPLPDCDAFAASGKPIAEQTNTQLMEGYRIGLAEMREACAKVAAGYDATPWKHCQTSTHAADMVSASIAAAIRAINFEGDTGFRPVSEMIAEHKQDPKKAAAIEKAKMRKAEQEPVAEALQIASVALQDISCSSQTDNLLWWQTRAREAQKQIAECLTNAAPVQQAEQEPLMDYERINALREGEQNGAEDAYFFVRPENDTPSLRKMFCQGFERGFHKGLKYASHVRTKDLTDEEQLELARSSVGKSRHWLVAAVIAAYKEKNK